MIGGTLAYLDYKAKPMVCEVVQDVATDLAMEMAKGGKQNVRTTKGDTIADEKANGDRNKQKRDNMKKNKPKSPKQKKKALKEKRKLKLQ